MIYIITGTLKNGKRFKPIKTLFPQNYNIWKGTVWRYDPDTNKRTKHYSVNN